MTYNVFGGTLNLAQSVGRPIVHGKIPVFTDTEVERSKVLVTFFLQFALAVWMQVCTLQPCSER